VLISVRLKTACRAPQSFYKSLAVSFEALPLQMQERYLNLAVLLENVPARW
jgi:hypothetical protein